MKRTLDIVSAPFGLDAKDVRDTAVPVQILNDAAQPTGVSFYVMHPVLGMESRVHNVIGLAAPYDTERGRNQLRASIVCAHEFMRDILDGRIDADNPQRTVLTLKERIFRFCMRDLHAKELYRTTGVDSARALIDHPRVAPAFRERRLPQMLDQLASRPRNRDSDSPELGLRRPGPGRDRGPER